MDPDAALLELRALAERLDPLSELEVERMRELFRGLDSWLSSGGFLPAPWAR